MNVAGLNRRGVVRTRRGGATLKPTSTTARTERVASPSPPITKRNGCPLPSGLRLRLHSIGHEGGGEPSWVSAAGHDRSKRLLDTSLYQGLNGSVMTDRATTSPRAGTDVKQQCCRDEKVEDGAGSVPDYLFSLIR